MNKTLLAFPLIFAVGCGVSDDTLLNEIDSDLWAKICDKATADSEDLVCGDVTYPASTPSDCTTAFDIDWGGDCTATFGDWRDCRDFEYSDPCAPDFSETPASCTALADCMM